MDFLSHNGKFYVPDVTTCNKQKDCLKRQSFSCVILFCHAAGASVELTKAPVSKSAVSQSSPKEAP